jgi:hypothetical protein
MALMMNCSCPLHAQHGISACIKVVYTGERRRHSLYSRISSYIKPYFIIYNVIHEYSEFRSPSVQQRCCNLSLSQHETCVWYVQIHRSFRKPLVIFTPKSQLLEFDDKADDPNIVGVRFKRLIMDNRETDRSPTPPPRPEVKRLIFCSGKVYYELEAAREEKGMNEEIAIARVEQLAPFPFDLVMRELKRYPSAQVRCADPCDFILLLLLLWVGSDAVGSPCRWTWLNQHQHSQVCR